MSDPVMMPVDTGSKILVECVLTEVGDDVKIEVAGKELVLTREELESVFVYGTAGTGWV